MEESLLKNPDSAELSEKFEDAAVIFPTSITALADVSKFECDNMTPQSFQLKLENISKSMRQDVEYNLFNTIYINHVPNYCYRVTTLGLIAIGKGWSEDEAKEKCAQALINKYDNIKSDSDKPMNVRKPTEEKDLDLGMTSLTINDVAPKISTSSTSHVKHHKTSIISNNLESKTFYSTSRQTNLGKNVAAITGAESETSSGLAMSIKTNKELPEKTVMDIQNVKTNSNTKSKSNKLIKPKIASIPVKLASSKISLDSNTLVDSAVNIRSKMEKKDRNGFFCSNPVEKLQEISINSNIRMPIFIDCQPSGPLGSVEHIVKCSFIGHNVYGQGQTKRKAKAQAAENMLRMMISFGWKINLG